MPSFMEDRGTRRMLTGIISCFAIYGIAKLASAPISEALGWNKTLFGIGLRTALAVICFIALGCGSWLKPDGKSIANTWRLMGYIIVVDIVLGVLSFLATIGSMDVEALEELTAADAMNNFLTVSLLCILVGINEEIMFRGLFFGGLLAKFGGTKRGVLVSAIVSSLVFGFFHVMTSIDPTDGSSILQGLMKTLQTATFGFVFCAPVLEDRRLCGAMSFHSFNDWTLMAGYVFTGLPDTLGQYINEDTQVAPVVLVLYAIMCLIYLPKCIRAAKRLLALEEPQYGPLMEGADVAEAA